MVIVLDLGFGLEEDSMSSRWILRMRVAWVLWTQRLKAGLSLNEAAKLCELSVEQVRNFELGIESPPLCYVSRLLRVYDADTEAILFFCCYPMGRMRGFRPQPQPLL